MHRSLRIAIVVALLAGGAVHAQSGSSIRYKWHDGQGLVHFSDSLNAEAMKYGYDLVNDHGMVIRHVPRQLTAEERVWPTSSPPKRRRKSVLRRISPMPKHRCCQPIRARRCTRSRCSRPGHHRSADPHHADQPAQPGKGADRAAQSCRDIESAKEKVPKFLIDSIAEQRRVVTDQRNTLHRQQALRVETVQQQVKAADPLSRAEGRAGQRLPLNPAIRHGRDPCHGTFRKAA